MKSFAKLTMVIMLLSVVAGGCERMCLNSAELNFSTPRDNMRTFIKAALIDDQKAMRSCWKVENIEGAPKLAELYYKMLATAIRFHSKLEYYYSSESLKEAGYVPSFLVNEIMVNGCMTKIEGSHAVLVGSGEMGPTFSKTNDIWLMVMPYKIAESAKDRQDYLKAYIETMELILRNCDFQNMPAKEVMDIYRKSCKAYQLAKVPVEAPKLGLDLSTPSSALKNFIDAVKNGNVDKFRACVVPSKNQPKSKFLKSYIEFLQATNLLYNLAQKNVIDIKNHIELSRLPVLKLNSLESYKIEIKEDKAIFANRNEVAPYEIKKINNKWYIDLPEKSFYRSNQVEKLRIYLNFKSTAIAIKKGCEILKKQKMKWADLQKRIARFQLEASYTCTEKMKDEGLFGGNHEKN